MVQVVLVERLPKHTQSVWSRTCGRERQAATRLPRSGVRPGPVKGSRRGQGLASHLSI